MHISLVAANTTTIEVLAIPEHAYLICSCVSSQFAKRPFLMARIQIYNIILFFDQAYEKKTTPKWRYDLGRKKNFEQVGTVKQRL